MMIPEFPLWARIWLEPGPPWPRTAMKKWKTSRKACKTLKSAWQLIIITLVVASTLPTCSPIWVRVNVLQSTSSTQSRLMEIQSMRTLAWVRHCSSIPKTKMLQSLTFKRFCPESLIISRPWLSLVSSILIEKNSINLLRSSSKLSKWIDSTHWP